MRSFLHGLRRFLVLLCHLLIIASSLTFAFWLRFDFSPSREDIALLQTALWMALPIKIIVFVYARLQRGGWRLAGVVDLLRLLVGNIVASAVFASAMLLAIGPSFPRSVYVIDFLLCFLLMGGMRLAVRLCLEILPGTFAKGLRKGCLIYGAGATGRLLLRELRSNPSLGYRVVGFLDDDPEMRGADYMGVPVLGTGREAAHVANRFRNHSPEIEEVIIALPSAGGRQMRDAIANCRAAGFMCKTVPGIKDILSGKVPSTEIRNVSPNDLLERSQIKLEEDQVWQSLAGRTVLVTGAAGSIGSELCRQIARFQPQSLVALDQAESDLFKIDLELRTSFPTLNVVPQIGDIRDSKRVEDVVLRHQVHSIFHAAAYKHVPLMENQTLEAVKNNVLGTWNLVRAAQRFRVSKFAMISTDKAVNPSSIMGLTKRVAELVVSSMQDPDRKAGTTRFVSVRFGNVLGSNGSVVPIFQAQIAAGGPITITHPEVRRYFMVVPEAVQLVLQASTMGKGSEIFVLDMGEPVRIFDLAVNMIRLAGLVPHEDIEIRFIGLRPGEKLYEEITFQGENVMPTYHEKIRIFRGSCPSRMHMVGWLTELESLIASQDESAVLSHLRLLVPEYRPAPVQRRPIVESLKTAKARA